MDQSYEDEQPCGLESLPLDAKVHIFKAIPDVPSLKSLVLTSASFYGVFKVFTPQILSAVLSNEIPAAILDDVSYTWTSSRSPNQSISGVLKFLKAYHPHPEITAGQITPPKLSISTLDDALVISKVHSNVRLFTRDFCSSILSRRPLQARRVPESPDPVVSYGKISDTENIRIMRAFYWFELYCNLHQKCHLPDGLSFSFPYFATNTSFIKSFYDKFYPWEIEQLCCIHEYLSRKIAPAFEDMVEHDVSWSNVVPYDDEDGRNDEKEYYTSKGLNTIRRVIQAKTFETRRTIFDWSFAHPDSISPLIRLSIGLKCTSEERTDLNFDLTSPRFLNADLGPYLAWRWAYERRAGIRRYCAELDIRGEREWGYCFWDRDKVQEWSLFKESWTPLRATMRATRRDREKKWWDAKLQVSRTIRKQIHDRGGRGWWAPGDWSRIRYIDGRKFEYFTLEIE